MDVDFSDPLACPECGSPERREKDIEQRGAYLDFKYICTDCGAAWTITEREEE